MTTNLITDISIKKTHSLPFHHFPLFPLFLTMFHADSILFMIMRLDEEEARKSSELFVAATAAVFDGISRRENERKRANRLRFCNCNCRLTPTTDDARK